jgi:Tfp pilus assembly protein PilF
MAVFRRARASFVCVAFLALAACSHQSGLPEPGSNEYRELVHVFNVGLSALQCGEDVRAKADLTKASQIAPGEPAVWADLGLLAVRQQEFESAWQNMDKARSLTPDNSRIEFYLGDIESKRGRLPEAIQHFRKAVELDGTNVKALYSLAEETERQGAGSSDAYALQDVKKILDQQPNNAAVLVDVARLAAKTGDAAALRSAISKLSQESSAWPDEARAQMATVAQAAAGPNPRDAALRVAFLRNVLLRVPSYRRSSDAVKTPPASAGEPFTKFLKLPSPSSEPAPPDLSTHFESQPLPGVPASHVQWVRAVYLDGSGKQSILWSDGESIHIVGGATLKTGPVSRNGVAVADLNFDFKNDLVVAGPKGVRIYRQEDPSHFTDVTSRTGLPGNIVNGSYTGVWPFDFDLDGDLDIVLGVNDAPPLVLRNNGDGTFAAVHPFNGSAGLSSFATADIAGLGAPDVAMVGQDGHLSVFMNDRRGQFHAGASVQGVLAVTAGDVDRNGLLDFIVWKSDGSIVRLSDGAVLAKSDPTGSATLAVADFDNNGSVDLLAGDEVFLSGEHGFTRLSSVPTIAGASVMDVNDDGLPDLIGLSPAGVPVALVNHGTKHYRWQSLRLRAANVYGDQRINAFGLGGEIEIRTGMLTEKEGIDAPVVHFGLGDHDGTDVARILWPNGLLQVEFELKADETVLAAQRLKGSCPSLFAWDGRRMSFVKDAAPLATGLGEDIPRTEEWYKLPGNQIQPRDGYYDLRVTDELWESYYIDSYSLLVVDHPQGTDIYSDERFPLPPKAKLYTVATPQPFGRVTDDLGHDVSEIVRSVDQNYLDTFGRGRFQGVTRDHWVELELPEDAPRSGPLYLIGDGWMHPTDASIDLAMSQGSEAREDGLRIEVPDANGQWVVARSKLGFPASKMKTVVIDIAGLFKPGAARKLRLATNMEIFWDRLAWAAGLPNEQIRTERLPLITAELRYRGFSVMNVAGPSSPEIPDYNALEGTGSKWQAIEGYYTRYGDVGELLRNVDDRYVIMGSGDEVRLRFRAASPPPAGWVRDFVMIGDGWIKDGDYNSAYSRTVQPLPYHGMSSYTNPPGRLEDDPEFRKHPADWQLFQTRYMAPDEFRSALWK